MINRVKQRARYPISRRYDFIWYALAVSGRGADSKELFHAPKRERHLVRTRTLNLVRSTCESM